MCDQLYQSESKAFKINLSAGAILKNIYTSDLTYFIAYSNFDIFRKPMLISTRRDLTKLKKKLKEIDFLQYALLNRSNSRYKALMITNIKFSLTKVNYPLGCTDISIPVWLSINKGLLFNANYKDNLCMFRALANQRTKLNHIPMRMIKSLFWQWKLYCKTKGIKDPGSIEQFKGIEFQHLCHFEKCFKTNINIYEREQSGETIPVFKSMHPYKCTLNLNKYQNHVCYITDMKKYCRKYKCTCCSRLFKGRYALSVHQNHCVKQSKLQYPSGFKQQKLSLFELLEHYGIFIHPSERYYDFMVTYDYECILQKITPQVTDKCEITHKHVPVSWACCSNVPGYLEPVCRVNEDPDALVKDMITYMYEIQAKAKELSMQKWGPALQKLDELIEKYKPVESDRSEDAMSAIEPDEPMSSQMINRMNKPNVYRQMQQNLHNTDNINVKYNDYPSDESSDDGVESDDENPFNTNDSNEAMYINANINDGNDENDDHVQWKNRLLKAHHNKLKRLRKQFERYISELVVLGFNNCNYDNLIAFESLIKHLDIANCEEPLIIKKNNSYHVIANQKLKILDISRYVAAGCSYSDFLKSYEIEEQKSCFFYEYLDSFQKLSEKELPPPEKWFSTLKNKNVLGNTPEEIEKNYQQMKQIWNDNKMTTLQDFLVYYNILDTSPFLKAALKLSEYYRVEHELDVFKRTISLPGVARILIYRSAYHRGASFYQFDESQADIYALFKKNITGGPSVIYHREMVCGETPIRGNPNEICKSIVGLDCNALYPASYYYRFPVRAPVFRWSHKHYAPETNERYVAMYDYMDYMASKTGLRIQHKLNSKTEVLIGLHPVDGYAVSKSGCRFCFEYDGCYYHGCVSCRTVSVKAKIKYAKLLAERKKRTEIRNEYIRSHGVVLCIMKECVWKKLIKTNKEIKQFVLSRRPQFYASHPKTCTQDEILTAVKNKKLFGFLLVDLECPTEWDENFRSDIPASDYYGEFNPIWMTTNVPFEHWGQHMQSFALQAGISLRPRKLLVGGTRGERLLILSDLLEW